MFPTDAPAAKHLELSLFGPGVGESIVVHLGHGQWLVVDSCTLDGAPAALSYLSAIGVAPTSIVQVIATHWHDDHIKGLHALLKAATSAKFVCSSALRRDEFVSMLAAQPAVRRNSALSSGVDEMKYVFDELHARGQQPVWATHDQRLLSLPHAAAVTSLSPSDAAITRGLLGLAEFMPRLSAAIRSIPAAAPNETSVVLHVEFGKAVVLLGADLEVTAQPDAGWHAIVGSTARPGTTARSFKVAHHGSANGHLDEAWTQLTTTPIAVLTPFTRSMLPRAEDVARIKQFASQVLQTAPASVPPVKRLSAVERTVREAAVKAPTPRRGRLGQVRVRIDSESGAIVSTECFGAAFAA